MENKEEESAQLQNQDILHKGVQNYNQRTEMLYKKIEELEVGFMKYQLQEKQRFDDMVNSLKDHMIEQQQQFEKNVGQIFEARQQQIIRVQQLEEIQQRFNQLMAQYQAQIHSNYHDNNIHVEEQKQQP
eukprot:TRINITY_DN1106_c0_g1_i1.p5 TRINITY_DN1106_c0_g1~~TRINITY_DN1106_c0_g1_i1.p5  ORF type:complete len:129 (-),score=17.33 TRINITY_DN1106_c0_g1_i1:379-765(-)